MKGIDDGEYWTNHLFTLYPEIGPNPLKKQEKIEA
jgi:hypothetical protein